MSFWLLCFDPDIIVLDEPTVGLDPVALIKLKELIASEKEAGKTILLTSHIMSVVEELADDVIFLLEEKSIFKVAFLICLVLIMRLD